MKRWERWSFNLAALLVALTGFAYFWMKYFVENPDPFAVVNHPWEPALLHVLAAPALILVFGLILNSHVLKKLSATKVPLRKSGLTSLGLFAAMVCSGYLLQVATSESWLRALVAVHVGTGAAFALVYPAHLMLSTRRARRPAASPMREVA